MTKVRFERMEGMDGVRIEGHQAEAKGEGLVCAAISAMGCTLINGLRGEDLMVPPHVRVGDGMLLVSCMRTPRVDAMFDMLERGLTALSIKEPGKIQFE